AAWLPSNGPVPLHRHGQRLQVHSLAEPGADCRHAALCPGAGENRRHRPGGFGADRPVWRRRAACLAGLPVPAHSGDRPVYFQHRYGGADGTGGHLHREPAWRFALPLRYDRRTGGLCGVYDAHFITGEYSGAGARAVSFRRFRPRRRTLHPAGDAGFGQAGALAVSLVDWVQFTRKWHIPSPYLTLPSSLLQNKKVTCPNAPHCFRSCWPVLSCCWWFTASAASSTRLCCPGWSRMACSALNRPPASLLGTTLAT